MAITSAFDRPLAQRTAPQSGSYAIAVAEDGTNKLFIATFTVVAGSNTKAYRRLKFPIGYTTGTSTPTVVTELIFPGNATNYSSSTVPPDSAAVVTNTITLTPVDMDAFFAAAGVPQS